MILLAEHFAVQLCAELGWPLFPGFSDEAVRALRGHHWPGNIRELKNAVERSLYRSGSAEEPLAELVIDPFDDPHGTTPPALAATPVPTDADAATQAVEPDLPGDLRQAVNDYEKTLLETTLERYGYNQARSADALGLSYNQIRGLVRKHGFASRNRRKESQT